MREIILDTETTGLHANAGDRLIEIGCIELVNRRLTGNNFHYYVNPERDSNPAALSVHGLTTEFLRDKPKFADILGDLRAYVRDAQIVIHNAVFDLSFLDAEYQREGIPAFKDDVTHIIDTLVEAKRLFPGKRNSLDALCDRYQVSRQHRTLHGALLDASLLAEVYLAMTRGQESLLIHNPRTDEFPFCLPQHRRFTQQNAPKEGGMIPHETGATPDILVIYATDAEQAAHANVLHDMKKVTEHCLWDLMNPSTTQGQT